jgi:NMD protein affecting ribosome stability and mRNA decay
MATRDAIRRQRAARVPHLFTCARCGRQVEQVHDGVCDDCQRKETNADKKS